MARNIEIGIVRVRYDVGWRVVLAVTIVALTALFICSCAPVQRRARTPVEQRATAVYLRSACGTAASGVILDARTILTAAHFPVGCPSAVYIAEDAAGAEYYVELDGVSDPDIARLRVLVGQRDLPSPGVPQTARAAGQVCASTAAPNRVRPCGVVTDRDGAAVKVTIPIRPGNSGSGVYDARGRLVGIVSACLSTGGVCTAAGGIVSEPGILAAP